MVSSSGPGMTFKEHVAGEDAWLARAFAAIEAAEVEAEASSKQQDQQAQPPPPPSPAAATRSATQAAAKGAAAPQASTPAAAPKATTAAPATAINITSSSSGVGGGGKRRMVLSRNLETFRVAPATFLDGLAAQKAREFRADKPGDKKKAGGGHSRKHSDSIDLKKLKANTDQLAVAASAAGVSPDILQYAVNSLPQLTRAEEDDKRTVFWKIIEDHFRRVDQTDLQTLKNFVRDPSVDTAFRIPPLGKKYRLQWLDEEKVQAQLERFSSSQGFAGAFRGGNGAGGGFGSAGAKGGGAGVGGFKSSPLVKSSSGSKAGGAGGSAKGASGGAAGGAGGGRGALAARKVTLTSTLSPKPEPQYIHAELCDVCFEGDSQEGNLILFCDACNVAVHQHCYGIPVVPEGQWLCNTCRDSGALQPKAGGSTPQKGKVSGKVSQDKNAFQCVLCPVKGGAMKPVASCPPVPTAAKGNGATQRSYAHLFCSQWIPETFIRGEDTGLMEPIQNVGAVSKDRFKLVCSICKQRHGACIQCCHGMCATAFHPLCARNAGLLMEIVGYDSDDIDMKVYCQKHSKRPVKRQLAPAADAAPSQGQAAAKKDQSGPAASVKREREDPQKGGAGSAAAAAAAPAAAMSPSPTPAKSKDSTAKAAAALPSTASNITGAKGKDLLAETQPDELRALVRQTCMIFGVKEAEVSRGAGVEASRVSDFLHKKKGGSLKEEDLGKLQAWLRKYAAGLLSADSGGGGKDQPEPTTAVKEAAKAEGANRGGTPSGAIVAGAGAAGVKPSPASTAVPGLPTIPKCFQHELSEYMHLYTKLLLETGVGGESPQKGSGGGGIPATFNLKPGKGMAISDDMAYALACSPESETMGEIFVMQHELAKQMVVNRRRIKALASKLGEQLPAEARRFNEREEDMRRVNKFIEASKEAKRLLKRERRAEQQKENLAAAEAAIAQSTRYSAGRQGSTEPKGEGEAGGGSASYQSLFVKDSTGAEVIVDPFTIQKADADLLCAVCGQGHSEEPNQIVFCEMCDLAVHQKCYGIREIPEGEWLCQPCHEYQEDCLRRGMPKSKIRKPRWLGGDFTGIDKVTCSLCPVKRGAFVKQPGTGGGWQHVVCSAYAGAAGSKPHLSCLVCKQKGGALVKLKAGSYIHPLCARAAEIPLPSKREDAARMPEGLVEHIHWLETNFVRLRQTRQELERLRLISDVLVKREKTKTTLLKAEQDYVMKCLQRPHFARDFEEKMKGDLSNSSPFVKRRRVMTVDQAKATNSKLPDGYVYVPLGLGQGKDNHK